MFSYVSNTDIISDTFVQPNLPDCLSSDHFMVSFYIANQLVSQHKSPSMPKFIPNYANADWDGMNSFFLVTKGQRLFIRKNLLNSWSNGKNQC